MKMIITTRMSIMIKIPREVRIAILVIATMVVVLTAIIIFFIISIFIMI